MRKILLLSYFCIITASTCLAQTIDGTFYLYKKDGGPANDIKEASYFNHVMKLNDTTYICRYYNAAGPMIRQESFKDSNLTIASGRFCWYNNQGMLDSTGLVQDGRKDGWWEYKISSTQTDVVTYDNGIITKKSTNFYDKYGKLINNARDAIQTDTTRHIQIQAKFGNGDRDWATYCQLHLVTPARLQNVLPTGKHTVTVCFLINKEGYTRDIYLYQSCEWSGDAEVMRLIADSPKWQPAVQDGRTVLYRQRQSLTYHVMSE